jgi:hypothetical protein
MAASTRDVFINCPFDDEFAPGFRALVFGVIACGFRARCARELDDAGETRIDKLYRIIEQCRFGIHDISKTELDIKNGLPRFNMPLELGIFLGAKRYGPKNQKNKRCVILDREQYRFQMFMSDIAGMDIKAHNGDPRLMVKCIRDFLVTSSKRKTVPTAMRILESYDAFLEALPELSRLSDFDPKDMLFPDFERWVIAWVDNNQPGKAA